MGEVESTTLMLLVLAIVFGSWLTRKIKKVRDPQPEKLPIHVSVAEGGLITKALRICIIDLSVFVTETLLVRFRVIVNVYITEGRLVTETLPSGILLFFAAEGFTSEAVFGIWHAG